MSNTSIAENLANAEDKAACDNTAKKFGGLQGGAGMDAEKHMQRVF